ncbi:19181_t:CDS:2 [Rhizophagus irregularis]|nr:19181_t:CDS:2 [Rhizophagus irregularis]
MSEHQFIVSLFDKKFVPEEIIEKLDYNTSSSNTTSNSLFPSQKTNNSLNNNILFVNNNLQQQHSRLLLSGKQFWPTSTPIRDDDYIIISNNSKFGSTFTSIIPIQENYEDQYNEYRKIYKKPCCSPSREKTFHKKQSNLLEKKIPSSYSPVKTLNYFCCDDMFNNRNPISPPINPVTISRNQTISYTSRHNLNPLLTPDERTSKPLRLILFNIHTYWQNWSIKYQIELPRNISFHRFKRVMSQMLRNEIPNDLIVLYHTERYTDDDVMIGFDSNNKEINRFLLDYLCKSDKIRVVTHDAVWSTYLLMWNDNEISITLFSKSLIEIKSQEEEEDLQIITSPKRSLNAYVPSSHPSYSLPRHSNLDKIRVCVRERCLSEKHINDVRKFAEKKGGPYLATKYINRQDPLIWQL